jgi:hypothetical protein
MTLPIPGKVGWIDQVYEHYRVSNQPGLALSMNSLGPVLSPLATPAPSVGGDSFLESDIASGAQTKDAATRPLSG